MHSADQHLMNLARFSFSVAPRLELYRGQTPNHLYYLVEYPVI